MPKIKEILEQSLQRRASDIHIAKDAAISFRIDGEIIPYDNHTLSYEEVKALCYEILNDNQIREFEKTKEIDLSFNFEDKARFRANIFYEQGSVAAALRPLSFIIPKLEELGFSKTILDLTNKPSGLILVTGPTGSGKSTTLAAMIDRINEEQKNHIITIEDPIEYVYSHKKSVVNQREVGRDTASFKNALKYILRQDPDVVLIGEMRDLETISAAITTAETGHLVFATLHTNSAPSTISRIIDVFPPHQQDQIRTQLSFILQAVISQQLIPKVGGGRVLGYELMIPTPAIRNLIRENKIHQIYSQMQVGQEHTGMITLNQALIKLVKNGLIDKKSALENSNNVEELVNIMK